MQHCRRLILTLGLIFFLSLSASAQPVQPITILTPGESSLVTAPIEVTALVYPGEDGVVRLTLVDRNQNLLARQLHRVETPSDGAIEFSTQLAFEIPTETSAAILTIATQDHAHRPLALRSINITLAGSGEDMIEPVSSTQSWLTITEPEPGAVISASPMLISGTVIPVNSNPIIFELLTERGGAIVSKQLAVETPGKAMAFEVPLIYPPVTETRDIRLIVRQSAGLAGVDAILDSLPVIIMP
jgi:hypothetical protein